jgi:hypothetical protein
MTRLTRFRYKEGIDIIYEQNIFDMNHVHTIQHLSSTIRAERFNQIRSLSLTWDCARFPLLPPQDGATWKDIWRIIANMKGLRSMHLILYETSRIGLDSLDEIKLLNPLYEVRQVPDFVVEMTNVPSGWPTKEAAPFILKEPDEERRYSDILGSHRGIVVQNVVGTLNQ